MNEIETNLPLCQDSNDYLDSEEMNFKVAVVSCPVCDNAYTARHRNNLSHCTSCNHIFQTDMQVTVSYDSDYAHQYDRVPHQAMSALRWNFIQSALNLPVGSKVLDIGYANGAFLKHARSNGMSIYGIDLHTEDFGIPVVDFDTPIEYDLVTFFDSLEHFPDFSPLLKLRVSNVVVSLPLTPDFLLEDARAWRHFKPGEHLHYFSPASLDRFMRNLGFPVRLAHGHPEDELRGKLIISGRQYDNIYTAVYSRSRQAFRESA